MTIGWVTLDVGEQAHIVKHTGHCRVEDGPKRLFLWREKYSLMKSYSANQNQYLQVKHKDGRIEHIPGPYQMFLNPTLHSSININQVIALDANEILVVYTRDQDTKKVSRYLAHGPKHFIPKPNEWLHEFEWHGTDPENKTRKLPGILKFTKLQVIPDQFYYNVDMVRTADDALIRVKLMIFYELRNIELMLNATKDPIADFINCVCADVVAFASKLTYMEFIEKSNELNEMTNYPQLLSRCKTIGYDVSKVVFRGYFASPKLQQMHDNAIEARTRLRIAYETEDQEQIMTDMKLNSEFERTELEQSMELERLKHEHNMELSKLNHKLELKKKEHEEKVKLQIQDADSKLKYTQATDQQEITYLNSLSDLGVTVNDYVLSKAQFPDKVVRVVSKEGAANLHLHQ